MTMVMYNASWHLQNIILYIVLPCKHFVGFLVFLGLFLWFPLCSEGNVIEWSSTGIRLYLKWANIHMSDLKKGVYWFATIICIFLFDLPSLFCWVVRNMFWANTCIQRLFSSFKRWWMRKSWHVANRHTKDSQSFYTKSFH